MSFAIRLYSASSPSRSKDTKVCHVQESFVKTHRSFSSIRQSGGRRKEKKNIRRGQYSLLKKVPRCSVDANYKEGHKTMLARWQCEKLDQVIDLDRMQKEKTRRKCCAKRGYSALLYSTIGLYPVVVIMMHMSKTVSGFVSCFCSCVVSSQRLQFKIIRP
jgi:hypothetical protein